MSCNPHNIVNSPGTSPTWQHLFGYSKREILDLLPRHAKCSPELLAEITKYPDVVIKNHADPRVKQIIGMVKAITKEAYRMQQFTRTEISAHGVLSGVIHVQHRVIDWTLVYFHHRFPTCVICLYDEISRKTYVMHPDLQSYCYPQPLHEIVNLYDADLPIQSQFAEMQQSSRELFEHFYSSQFIVERANRPYFQKMIPDSCMELPGMKGGTERWFRNRRLDSYIPKTK